MNKSILIALAVIVLLAATARSQVEGPLKLVGAIPLPGLHDGDFDHFQVDLPGRRLFLAAEENSAVEVIDLRANKLVHTIKGPKAPHSIAYDPESKKLFVVDDGGPSQVWVYDGTAFKLLDMIPMEAHADISIYDPSSKLLYVGNGGKDANEDYCLISIVDTQRDQKLGNIKVDSDRIEGIALEESGPRLFVGMYSKNAVGVIDRDKRTMIATWSIAEEGRRNAPMAFDEADHRLFVVARDPGRVIVLDADSGKIITSLPGGSMLSDDAFFDPILKRLYVTGIPFLSVFQKREGDSYQMLGQVPTAFHALEAILVSQLSRYYLSVPHHGKVEAQVQVYETVP